MRAQQTDDFNDAPRTIVLPRVLVAARVVAKMIRAARRHLADETGEAMVGVVLEGAAGQPRTIVVLDTIAPDDTSTVRRSHTFQQGDERQDELLYWLQENWRFARQKRREQGGAPSLWDAPLDYLGDWHKHPGHMIQPSFGDLRTATSWISDGDNRTSFLLAPILTLGHSATVIGDNNSNFMLVPMGDVDSGARIDFWYIERGMGTFAAVIPALLTNENAPATTPAPWHLADPRRFEKEMALLQRDGLLATLLLWDADGAPPMEVCFLTARMGASKVLLLATSLDYPRTPPSARLATFSGLGEDGDLYQSFAEMWMESDPVPDPPGWRWSADKTLAGYVAAHETVLGLRPVPPPAAPTSEESPVDASDAAADDTLLDAPQTDATTPLPTQADPKDPA